MSTIPVPVPPIPFTRIGMDIWGPMIKSVTGQGVWEFVDLPSGANLIGTRWVFKLKLDSLGNVARYKARLVAQGFNQREGIDYDKIYAPVVKFDSVRTLLALVEASNWELKQLDVTTAFLYAPVKEDIYLKAPDGVDVPPGQVLKLKKSLYGLKHSPRNWNIVLDTWLKEYGFEQSRVDTATYIFPGMCVLLVYVDDIIGACLSDPWWDRFIGTTLVNDLISQISATLIGFWAWKYCGTEPLVPLL
jgi:hypothetical protein